MGKGSGQRNGQRDPAPADGDKGEFVILSPTTASEEMLRMAAANGDQRAARELTRRQRIAA